MDLAGQFNLSVTAPGGSVLPDILPALSIALLIAFLVVALLTPFVGRLARRLGAVDDPGGRRIHSTATPRMGGLAIAVGAFLGFLIALSVPGIGRFGHSPLLTVFGATAGMLALGFYDDFRQVRPTLKLAVQIVLAAVCWRGGVRVDWITLPFAREFGISPATSLVLTIAWIVGITNAINLLDGLDGLAAGVSAIVTTTLMLVGLMTDYSGVFLIFTAGTLGAACLGFLVHNRHPARIFMGDTGSLFLGFLVANIAVLTYRKQTTAVVLGIPLLALGVPISDTVLAFTRRILQGRSPFVADRHHLHHVLHRIGLGRRSAVLIIYGGTGLLCAVALFALKFDNPRTLLLGAVFLVGGLIWLYALVRMSKTDGSGGPRRARIRKSLRRKERDRDFSDTDPMLQPIGSGGPDPS